MTKKSHRLLLCLTVGALSWSCVSKKKFEATQLQHDSERQSLEQLIANRDYQISVKNRSIDSLEIVLARSQGANDALLISQDKLLDRIDEVQAQLENTRKDKSNTTQGLMTDLRGKDEIISQKNQLLSDIKNQIAQFENQQDQIISDFTLELEPLFGEQQSVSFINNEIRITYDEELLFRPGSSRVRSSGVAKLEKMVELMNRYPALKLIVIGNTDNNKPRNYKDNWDFSVIRASNVVKIMTDEFGLAPSRVTAGGKGEFAPKASNQTPDGQQTNRRIDFVVLPRYDRLVKTIKEKVAEEDTGK